ncbi:transposase [Rheinheimera pacifica]|uniref:transposase n=1 Tax=Rheinheimera pacifica TaxID=173990 RepID=UPI000B88BCB2|nr:transposase [Rheinheimera pacifica]
MIFIDAGFKVPWFKQISKLGLYYISRVRGNQTLQLPGQDTFITVAQACKQARTTPQLLGEVKLTQAQQYSTGMRFHLLTWGCDYVSSSGRG